VYDGCGLLDVNSFPGLSEFNVLAAELNALVEKNVIPALRDQAAVGTEVVFSGCAEAPESLPASGKPLLSIAWAWLSCWPAVALAKMNSRGRDS
jgi:hypothetical protein